MTTPTPGTTYATGVASIGGRGQEAVVPYPFALHTLTLTRVTVDTIPDHYTTAQEALDARVRRFQETGTPYTRDGMTLRYTDHGGAKVTLEYTEPQEGQ